MHQRILSLFFLLFITINLQAQDLWTLDKCIRYATENSLQVQQAQLGLAQAQLTKKQAVWAQSPTLSASFRHGINFGRSIDPTSYSFNDIPTQNSAIALNLNMVLFQGLQIRNTIRQSKVDLEATQKDVEQAKNDVALSVAQTYLSILLATENVEVLVEQGKVTEAQYQQTLKLIAAGVLAENARYDLEAQIARDEENILKAQNAADLAYVNLKMFMNLDVSKQISIERVREVELQEKEALATLDEVFDEAIKNQANILASKLRENSADLGVKIAKGGLWPTLSLYGGANTNFSSAYAQPKYTTTVETLNGVVTSSSEPVEVYTNGVRAEKGDPIPYFLQLGGNTTGNVGLNLSIPIFNGLRTRINIQRAELNVKIAQLGTTQLETTLKSNIERSLTDVKAAEKRLNAATKTVTSTRLSAENTRKRYDLGVVNSFELTSVQNTLIAAESNLLQAKYDYLFKLKILDYYRGRPIQIN